MQMGSLRNLGYYQPESLRLTTQFVKVCAMKTTTDHEYEDNASWGRILVGVTFFGACAAALAIAAVTNDRGLVINGIALSKNSAILLYWGLCALSHGFVAYSAYLAFRRLTQHQRKARKESEKPHD